ncbi:MAG TPA: AAA-associated domain-containing protein [Polyangiaceae bacterium]|nr:AAA-associated domain-containing protein [Polyangiaceae bacterium]
MKGPTELGWEALDRHFSITDRLTRGEVIELSAPDIKNVSQREPRLMSKFDTRESRPTPLRNATILPVSNGAYVVLPGDGYFDTESAARKKHWPASGSVRRLCTLPWASGPTSESQALDMALATGVVHDFLQDPAACLTIRGRLRSPEFELGFGRSETPIPLKVSGVQIEVDSGLEGEAIHVIEAKLGTRTNFHIRQLYYPYRMWLALQQYKPVKTVFFSWSNRCFSFRSFGFTRPEHYHSIALLDAADYYLDDPALLPPLSRIVGGAGKEALPTEVPFPQADDVRRVIDVLDAVSNGTSNRTELSKYYEFNERQSDYYANAAAFLGYLSRSDAGFGLTPLGSEFVSLPMHERHRRFIERMAMLPVFREVLESLCSNRALPESDWTAELIRRSTGLSGKTPERRARTVLSWARWAEQVTAEAERARAG